MAVAAASTPASDLLLLAVGPRAGWTGRGPIGIALAGGLLCEQLLAAGPRILLPPGRRHLVRHLLDQEVVATAAVAAHLCTAGVLEPAEYRVLRVFPRRGYAVRHESSRADAVQRLRYGLVPGTQPPPAPALLAVLAAVSGVARAWVPPPARRRDRRAVAQHLNGLRTVVGPDVAEVLLAVRKAYRRSGGGGSGGGDFVSESGDGYGDSGGSGDGGGDGGGGGD